MTINQAIDLVFRKRTALLKRLANGVVAKSGSKLSTFNRRIVGSNPTGPTKKDA